MTGAVGMTTDVVEAGVIVGMIIGDVVMMGGAITADR